MRFILTFIVMLSYFFINAAPFKYPTIFPEGNSILSFVPPGWTIIDSAEGDLNKDGLKDFAFVLEYKDSVTEIIAEDTEFNKPRILIIVFRDEKGSYLLFKQNNTFILRASEGGMLGDPFYEGQSLSIENGCLHISFSGGSRYMWMVDYNFRFQDDKWCLIGAETGNLDRLQQDTDREISYNFLIAKAKITTHLPGQENKSTEKTHWIKLKSKELRTFETLKHPFTWEVIKGEYL